MHMHISSMGMKIKKLFIMSLKYTLIFIILSLNKMKQKDKHAQLQILNVGMRDVRCLY